MTKEEEEKLLANQFLSFLFGIVHNFEEKVSGCEFLEREATEIKENLGVLSERINTQN